MLVPVPAHGASDADAWMSARQLHTTHSATIGAAARGFTQGGDSDDLRELRAVVAEAIRALDRLEVKPCFRIWWSYVRSSYVMFDVALVSVQQADVAGARSATAASVFLSSMAQSTVVDCPQDGTSRRADRARPRGGGPVVFEALELPFS